MIPEELVSKLRFRYSERKNQVLRKLSREVKTETLPTLVENLGLEAVGLQPEFWATILNYHQNHSVDEGSSIESIDRVIIPLQTIVHTTIIPVTLEILIEILVEIDKKDESPPDIRALLPQLWSDLSDEAFVDLLHLLSASQYPSNSSS